MSRRLEVSDLLWWTREEVMEALIKDIAGIKHKIPKEGFTCQWYAINRKGQMITIGGIEMFAILYRGVMDNAIPNNDYVPELTKETKAIIKAYVDVESAKLKKI